MSKAARALRSIPDTLDPAVVQAIDARLDGVAADHVVAIPLAVESGSRAWGFPSPDSDYDCRFVFVRPRARYLSLWPERDVIETPLDAVLDVNGWDLGKLLRLLVKGNAVAIEWLQSPIVYRGDAGFRAALGDFAAVHVRRALIRRHYRHLGQRQWARHGEAPIAGKKLFYAMRPAAALRWMRLHPDALPPMHFPTLIAGCDADAQVDAIVADLLARKAQAREMGVMTVPQAIAAFIADELGDGPVEPCEQDGDTVAREAADRLFVELVDAHGPR